MGGAGAAAEIEFSLEELGRACLADPEGLVRRLRGKSLKVTGPAENFSRWSDGVVVYFEKITGADGRSFSLNYKFPITEDQELTRAVSRMTRGERVTITCKVPKLGLRGGLGLGAAEVPEPERCNFSVE